MESLKSPEILWHYTDANGLLGILQSQGFWASSATYLNDDQELKYGVVRLAQTLLSIADVLGWEHHVDEYGYSIRQYALALAGDEKVRVEIPLVPDTYIVSFCEDGDILSQWRGYSEGSGFALGFDRALLERFVKSSLKPPARLGKVQYGDTASKNMFDSLILNQFACSTDLPQVNKRLPHPQIWDQFHESSTFPQVDIKELLQEVGWCKHGAFAEEKEWRLKIDRPESVKVRAKAGDLLPYAEFSFPPSALKEVRLGPGGFRDLRETAVKHALQDQGFSVFKHGGDVDTEVHISRSSAPYRP